MGSIFLAVAVAFVSYLYVPTFFSSQKSPEKAFETYLDQDVTSVATVSKRSNMARMGNTVALFSVGLENPVFGVGCRFESPYVADHFPEFAKDSGEVKRWIAMLWREGFLKSGIPSFNMFGIIMCRYGIPGLLLFCVPLGIIGGYFLRRSRIILGDFGNVCVLVALGGQVACLLSNTIFYTYPLAVSMALLLMRRVLRGRSVANLGDEDFRDCKTLSFFPL